MNIQYPLTYSHMSEREDLTKALMTNGFDSKIFIKWWQITLEMSLDGIVLVNNIISHDFYLICQANNIDYREIILNSIFDRALVINRYSDEIWNSPDIWQTIFCAPSQIDKISAMTILKKLGFLDMYFCKRNMHMITNLSENMKRNIYGLYESYLDEMDYYSSTSDLDEDGILEVLQKHLLLFKTKRSYFDFRDYYKDFGSKFYNP